MSNYTVYMHITPSRKKYIGITKLKPEDRWRNGRGYYGSIFYRAVCKYGWENIKHGIFAEGLSLEDAEALEVALSAYGYNVSLGGHVALRDPSPEFKEKLRLVNTGKNNKKSMQIKCLNTEKIYESIRGAASDLGLSHNNIRRVLYGRNKCTAGYNFEFVDKSNCEGKMVHHLSMQDVHNLQKKRVAVYSMDGTLLSIEESRKAAGETYGFSSLQVSNCIKGWKKSLGGYRFLEAATESVPVKIPAYVGQRGANNPSARAVICRDLNGKFIKEYPYATLAAKELGCDLSAIIKNCRGKILSVKGYIFKYA